MKLLRERRFLPLFMTQFFGALNDNLLKNALIILVTYKAAVVAGLPASQMVSVAGGIFILPFFLFSATAGQLADKLEKSFLIRWIKKIEIAIMVIATYGFLENQFEFLLFVLFLMGLHSTFFGPLKFSILPQHLKDSELVGGNALIEAGTFLAILLGTILGGVLVTVPGWGPEVVSAGLLIVAVLGYGSSRWIPSAPAVAPTLVVHWNPITPTWQILKSSTKNKSVFLSILGISWFWFFGAATLALFPSYCKDVLHGEPGVVTLFLACFSIGVGLGSLLCERLSKKSLELGLVPLGAIGISFFALDFSISGRAHHFHNANDVPMGAISLFQSFAGLHVLADLVLLALFSGLFIVPLNALMQERSDPSERSRVIASNNILNALTMVLSAGFVVALLKAGLEIPSIFTVLSLLNVIVAVLMFRAVPEFWQRFLIWSRLRRTGR